MNDIEVLKGQIQRKAKWLKYGLAATGIIIVGPLFYLLAYAMLGVAFASGAALLAWAAASALTAFAPVISMKFENAKINMIMAEATKNPIPTLWAAHEVDAKDLADMEQAIVDYETDILNVRDKTTQLAKDMKPEDVVLFENDIRAMEADLALQQQDLLEAQQAHKAQEVAITRAAAIWELGMTVSRANQRNMADRAASTLQRIKKETALDAVTDSMNRSKAQLNRRIRNRASQHVIANDPSPAITITTVEAKCSVS